MFGLVRVSSGLQQRRIYILSLGRKGGWIERAFPLMHLNCLQLKNNFYVKEPVLIHADVKKKEAYFEVTCFLQMQIWG